LSNGLQWTAGQRFSANFLSQRVYARGITVKTS
jgi:hypothetical protein